MALLQRLLSTDKVRREECVGPWEEIEEGQPHNPYTEILLLQHHTDIVRILLKISNKRFVSAGDDRQAIIWDVQTGQRVAVLSGHTLPITCLIHLPVHGSGLTQCALIVSGSSDKQIRIWDAETGCCQHILTGHNSSVRCLQALNNGLFCAGGEIISLWTRHGELLHLIKVQVTDDYISLMIGMKNERIITAAGKDLVIFCLNHEEDEPKHQLEELKQISLHKEAILSLCVISKTIFASGSVDGIIIIWDSTSLQACKKVNARSDSAVTKGFCHSVQTMFCVQERYLFAATGCGFFAFDVATDMDKLVLQRRRAHLSKITCMGFACGGEYLATCSEDRSLRLWGRKPNADQDVVPLTPMERFSGMQNSELSSNWQEVWEPALLGECSAHGGNVQGFLDFDHEGIVTCGADGLVIVWKNWEMQKVRRNQAIQKILWQQENKHLINSYDS